MVSCHRIVNTSRTGTEKPEMKDEGDIDMGKNRYKRTGYGSKSRQGTLCDTLIRGLY